MKKVLLLKNVRDNEDLGIFSTLDNAKDEVIRGLRKDISYIKNYYNIISEKEKQAIIAEIIEDIDCINKLHTIKDFNDEMIDNYEITEWEVDG